MTQSDSKTLCEDVCASNKTQKVAPVLASIVLAGGALCYICTQLEIPQKYPDFVVGNTTWGAQGKLEDLIAVPVFIGVAFLSFILFSFLIRKQKQLFGQDRSNKLASQIIWWSLPAMTSIFRLISGASIYPALFSISAVGLTILVIASVSSNARKNSLDFEATGLLVLSVLMLAIIPLEIATVLGRLPLRWVGEVHIAGYKTATYLIAAGGLIAVCAYLCTCRKPKFRALPKLLLVGQLCLPAFFVMLYPAKLLQPDLSLTAYGTTIWLKLFLIGLILLGVCDVIRLYIKHSGTTESLKLLSPIAIFAFLVSIRCGNTLAPFIASDDYHFGELLIGWWSYIQGAVPYVGYIPAHGLIDDDLGGILSWIFYDGTAASIREASRLGLAIVELGVFVSIYYFSRSMGFAFVSALASYQLGWLFFTPFICLWFSHFAKQYASRWIAVWMITAPIVVLACPPQGLILIACSGIMLLHAIWRIWEDRSNASFKGIGISLVVIGALALFTPIIPMLWGCVMYVWANASVNQVAYGIGWHDTLVSGRFGASVLFEIIRMSWVAIPIVCLGLVYANFKSVIFRKDLMCQILVVLFFTILLIPYAMGRVDPGYLSRPGKVAVFGFGILLPLAIWDLFKPANKILLVVVVACINAAIVGDFDPRFFSSLISATASRIPTAQLRDGQDVGLANMGKAYVDDLHWTRLGRLEKLLSRNLTPEETYLDLTSRNAQYFYLNRKPPVPVTAPYNMVPLYQQKKAVEQLSQNMPTLALLGGDNIIHDGGGLALRNPYLYRFVVDNYVPRFDGGFIVGLNKSHSPDSDGPFIHVDLADITDTNWKLGVEHLGRAIVTNDPVLASFVNAGDKLRFADGVSRQIQRISGKAPWLELWLDAPIAPESNARVRDVQLLSTESVVREYRGALLQSALATNELAKIPVSWGMSQDSLEKKMSYVENLETLKSSVYQMRPEDGLYRIDGVDPQKSFDLSTLNLSGQDAGLLRFDFLCEGQAAEPRIQVYWWGDDRQGPFEAASLIFTASNGPLIVPLDASPRWLTLKQVRGLRIDLNNSSACSRIAISNVRLYQRTF